MNNSDYFDNHTLVKKWPFSIYHDPIEQETLRVLESLQLPAAKVAALNVGCGLFHEYPSWSQYAQWTACDLDPRTLTEVQKRWPQVPTFLVDATHSFGNNKFDLIVAKEVIEHVRDDQAWLLGLIKALKPGGLLVLSTPNYGLSLLPLIEYTFLEIIARSKGFSRFNIHPNKFSYKKLRTTLQAVKGLEATFTIRRVSLGMVLFSVARKESIAH